MTLKFYNTMTRKKEVFRPLKRGVVTMYNCGPTVYFYIHIGNARAFMFADILRRYLEYKDFVVKQVMNITDVGHMIFDEEAEGAGEDKIEKSAKEQKKTPKEIANFYIKAFLKDSKALNLKEPFKRPKATEHIKEMIGIIEKLVKKGYAYVAESGAVYYDVDKFKDYGRLSGNTIDKLEAGKRIEVNPEKKNWYDFALWKIDPNHLMQWDSPWRRGYPGWHIECSAMSMKYLGETLDIHTGGEDNIFPHHECEIAQSEGSTGKQFARFWMHARHLLVNGEKMSKSRGNFYTLRDLLDKGYDPKAIRYLLLSAHYRTRLNFTEKGLKEAEKTIKSIEEFVSKVKNGKDNEKSNKLVKKAKKGFEDALDDDLNISLALSVVFNLIREVNKTGGGKNVHKTMLEFDKVLGLELDKIGELWHPPEKAPREIKKLILKREKLRKDKKFREADRIREQLREKGIVLEDTEKGTMWKKVG
jgi:cysteinyl-tRNA synthetase